MGKLKLPTLFFFIMQLILSAEIFNTPVGEFYNFPVTHYRLFFMTLAYVGFVASLKRRRNLKFLFVAAAVMMGFFGIEYINFGKLPEYLLSYYVSGPLTFFAFSALANNIRTYKAMLWSYVFFAGVNLSIGLVEYFSRTNILGQTPFRHDGFFMPPFFSGIRVDGLFKVPEPFVLTLSLAVICLMILKNFEPKKIHSVLIVVFVAGNLICYFTINMAILFAMFVLNSSLYTKVKNSRRLNQVKSLVAGKLQLIIAGTGVIGFAAFVFSNEYLFNKMRGSFFSRVGGYLLNLDAIKANPWLGVGNYTDTVKVNTTFAGFHANRAPHNIILQLLSQGGVLLLVLMAIYLIYIVFQIKDLKISILQRYVLVYVLIYGMIFGIFSFYNYNDTLYALLASSICVFSTRGKPVSEQSDELAGLQLSQ